MAERQTAVEKTAAQKTEDAYITNLRREIRTGQTRSSTPRKYTEEQMLAKNDALGQALAAKGHQAEMKEEIAGVKDGLKKGSEQSGCGSRQHQEDIQEDTQGDIRCQG